MTDDARKEQPVTPERPGAVVPPFTTTPSLPKSPVPAPAVPAPLPAPPSPNPVKSAPASAAVPPVEKPAAPSVSPAAVPEPQFPLGATAAPPAPAPAKPGGTGELAPLRETRQLSDMTNNKCPTCGLVNRVGVLVCENCGTSLLSGAASVPSTRSLQDKNGGTGQLPGERLPNKLLDVEKLPLTTLRMESKSILDTAQTGVSEDTILKLEIPGTQQPLMVLPKREVMVGRKDLTTGTNPDLDLTPYAGYRMGVSRRHAVFRMYDRRIEVVDLGSSNGSRLNGIVMSAHQPYLLRDGDLLCFGKMEMRVTFHTPPPRITRL